MAPITFNPSATSVQSKGSEEISSADSNINLSQNQTEFETLMATAPQPDYKSLFNNLPSDKQQQISTSLNQFNTATLSATEALNAANDAALAYKVIENPSVTQTLDYASTLQNALQKVNDQVKSGLDYLDTLKNANSEMLQSPPIPDFSANLLGLMITSGLYPSANYKGLAEYFSVPPELVLQSLKNSGSTDDLIKEAAGALGVPIPA
jgi:hypothetical protein